MVLLDRVLLLHLHWITLLSLKGLSLYRKFKRRRWKLLREIVCVVERGKGEQAGSLGDCEILGSGPKPFQIRSAWWPSFLRERTGQEFPRQVLYLYRDWMD